MVKPALAQTKPAVPEFTLKFSDDSYGYSVPPTYSIDTFTGKNVTTQVGYYTYVENKSVEVTIKNQPFDNYKDSNGNTITLNYNIRWKGHFGDYWNELQSSLGGIYLVASSSLMQSSGGQVTLVAPNSQVTVVSYNSEENNGSNYNRLYIGNLSAGDQIDFQVEALVGYYTTLTGTPDPLFHRTTESYVFTGAESGWSNTQTITIPDTSITSPTPSLAPSPSIPEFPSFVVVSFLMAATVLTAIFYKGKHSRLELITKQE